MRCPWISVKSRNSERLLGWRNLRRITARSLFAQWRRHRSTIGWYQLFYLVFTPCAISKFITTIYAYLCFQYFSKQFNDDYLSNHLNGQEARKVFIQHPRYNIEVLLKRTKVGRAIIHSHWPKVQGHSTSLKAQYLPSASAVSQMKFICLFTVYDAIFQRFLMLHVKLGAVV